MTYGVTVQRGQGRIVKETAGRQGREGEGRAAQERTDKAVQCSAGQGRAGHYFAGQNHLLFPNRVALLGGVADPVRTSPSRRLGTFQTIRPENHHSC